MPAASLLNAFRVLTFVLMVATAVRLYRCGLHRTYKIFFSYLLFHALRSAVMYPVPLRSPVYFWLWSSTEPILCVFYVLLVLELYSLVLEKYKGLRSLGTWTLYATLVLSVVVSAVSLAPPSNFSHNVSAFLAHLYFAERVLFTNLLVFLLLVLLFFTRYPIRLPRNVIVHSSIYFFYFLTLGAGAMLLSLLGFSITRSANVVVNGINVGCILAWFVLLKPQGEAVSVTAWPKWGPDHEQRLIAQLNSFNATLLRAARK